MKKNFKKVNAGIIVIGNEILSGRTQDLNVSFISKWLNEKNGILVHEVRVIPDVEKIIVNTTNELRKKLLKNIQKLSKDQEEAILLHYFSGYKQREVSRILKKSDKATESLIIRARKKLKTILPNNILEELLYV